MSIAVGLRIILASGNKVGWGWREGWTGDQYHLKAYYSSSGLK